MLRRGPSKVQFWFIALVVGIASSLAAVTFRARGGVSGATWRYRLFPMIIRRYEAVRKKQARFFTT